MDNWNEWLRTVISDRQILCEEDHPDLTEDQALEDLITMIKAESLSQDDIFQLIADYNDKLLEEEATYRTNYFTITGYIVVMNNMRRKDLELPEIYPTSVVDNWGSSEVEGVEHLDSMSGQSMCCHLEGNCNHHNNDVDAQKQLIFFDRGNTWWHQTDSDGNPILDGRQSPNRPVQPFNKDLRLWIEVSLDEEDTD